VTPPQSYDKWDNLIKDLTQHWTERYGANEVKQWYFEIWNKADYPGSGDRTILKTRAASISSFTPTRRRRSRA